MHSAARPSASTQPLSSTSWSDTTNAIPLTSSPIHGALPAWSPDGSQIAFMATPKGKSARRIYLIARDGGEPKPVPPDTLWPLAPLASEHWQGGPTWSPDGTQIAIGENGDHFPLSPVCAISHFPSRYSDLVHHPSFRRSPERPLVAGRPLLGRPHPRRQEADALRLSERRSGRCWTTASSATTLPSPKFLGPKS